MILRKIDPAIAGINNPVRSPVAALIIDVAFIIFATRLIWQQPVIVAKMISADAFSGGYLPEISLRTDPAQIPGFFFSNIVIRKMPVEMQVEGNLLFCIVAALFRKLFLCGRVLGG